MVITWSVDYDCEFEDDVLMDFAADIIKEQTEPISSMELVEKAINAYIPTLDDEYYYALTADAINFANNVFWNRKHQKLEKMLRKAGLEQY